MIFFKSALIKFIRVISKLPLPFSKMGQNEMPGTETTLCMRGLDEFPMNGKRVCRILFVSEEG